MSLIVDPGQVRLGDETLPGIPESMDIRRRLRVIDIWVQARSGRGKAPMGWEDAEITLRLRLVDNGGPTPFEQVAQLERLFATPDEFGRPKVFRIVNPHTRARGVNEVIFEDLRTQEDNRDDTIRAELILLEYLPGVVRAEEMADDPPEMQGAVDFWSVPTPPHPPVEMPPTPAVDDDEV